MSNSTFYARKLRNMRRMRSVHAGDQEFDNPTYEQYPSFLHKNTNKKKKTADQSQKHATGSRKQKLHHPQGTSDSKPHSEQHEGHVTQPDSDSVASHGENEARIHVFTTSFDENVVEKTKSLQISHAQAEVEVIVERLQMIYGSSASALLHLVKVEDIGSALSVEAEGAVEFTESMLLTLATILLQDGASPHEKDEYGRSALYYAVKRDLVQVARKLLHFKATANAPDNTGVIPLDIVLDKKRMVDKEKVKVIDEMAQLLMAYTPNHEVRNYFSSSSKQEARFVFHDLFKFGMTNAIMGVLENLIDHRPDGTSEVHFGLLDADVHGRTPLDENYNSKSRTAIHHIAITKNKEAISHSAVRLLLRRKWLGFARKQCITRVLLYMSFLVNLTFVLVVGAEANDPLVYDSWIQYCRAVAEVVMCLVVGYHCLLEFTQMYKTRSDYWVDPVNWLDLSAISLMIAVVPLRFVATRASWPVFGVGYFLWVVRMFKYAAVNRSTGTFVQILYNIVITDMVQFLAVCMVVLLAFSGLLFAGLKYDGYHDGYDNDGYDEDDVVNSNTMSFWSALLTSTRTMIEQEAVVEYMEEGNFGPFSITVMMLLLFTTLMVLLNILIARFTDTYQNVQQDAERGMELERAWIISRYERQSFINDFRREFYQHHMGGKIKVISNLHKELEQWEGNVVSERNRLLNDLQDQLDRHEFYLRGMKAQMVDLAGLLQTLVNDKSNQIQPKSKRKFHGDTVPT